MNSRTSSCCTALGALMSLAIVLSAAWAFAQEVPTDDAGVPPARPTSGSAQGDAPTAAPVPDTVPSSDAQAPVSAPPRTERPPTHDELMRNYRLAKLERDNDLVDDPDYQSGRTMRTAGIVILAVGVAGGAVLSMFGSLAGLGGGREPGPFFIGAAVSAVAGLGIGIPLWVVGQKQVADARARHEATVMPQLRVSLGNQSGGLQATWRF